jgi:hypothetical protein
MASSPAASISSALSVSLAVVDGIDPGYVGEIPHSVQQTTSDARCSSGASGNLVGAVGRDPDVEHQLPIYPSPARPEAPLPHPRDLC